VKKAFGQRRFEPCRVQVKFQSRFKGDYAPRDIESRPASMSIFPSPWRPQSACKPAKRSNGNCSIAVNYT